MNWIPMMSPVDEPPHSPDSRRSGSQREEDRVLRLRLRPARSVALAVDAHERWDLPRRPLQEPFARDVHDLLFARVDLCGPVSFRASDRSPQRLSSFASGERAPPVDSDGSTSACCSSRRHHRTAPQWHLEDRRRGTGVFRRKRHGELWTRGLRPRISGNRATSGGTMTLPRRISEVFWPTIRSAAHGGAWFGKRRSPRRVGTEGLVHYLRRAVRGTTQAVRDVVLERRLAQPR